MKLKHFATATAAVALLGGAAYAQQPQPAKAPTPGSVTGDWNGAHAPTDDKQYTEEVRVPIGAPPADASLAPPPADTSATAGTSIGTDVSAQSEPAPSATGVAQDVSLTTTMVTNGPVPDTPENREKFGGPNSRAGKMTDPVGN